MHPPLLFRRAQGRDAQVLSAIAFAAKQHWGYPAEWMDQWRGELRLTSEYINAQPVYVAKQAGKIVGFFGLKLGADGQYLEHIWLRPACIGKGLGRALFVEAVGQARMAHVTELRIKSDPHAELFYLKMGAVRVGLESYELLGKIHREVPLLTYSIR
jgi:GNAT superfamily N-acetyltransferase